MSNEFERLWGCLTAEQRSRFAEEIKKCSAINSVRIATYGKPLPAGQPRQKMYEMARQARMLYAAPPPG